MSDTVSRDFDRCESLVLGLHPPLQRPMRPLLQPARGRAATRWTLEECLAVVANLPARIDRLILSGGEPLTERPKLYAILEAVREQLRQRHPGDAADQRRSADRRAARRDPGARGEPDRRRLDRPLPPPRRRPERRAGKPFPVARHARRGHRSADHPRGLPAAGNPVVRLLGRHRRHVAGRQLGSRPGARKGYLEEGRRATTSAPSSPAPKDFSAGTELPQEISIQLWKIHPCCPGTRARSATPGREKVAEVLERFSGSPIFEALNQGDPYGMGESVGISAEQRRASEPTELGNVCLWCDEFSDVTTTWRTTGRGRRAEQRLRRCRSSAGGGAEI